ncbi:MAG: hypothetical protein KC466_19215 [Myxococcales bacterium]|nr:hypothetical protein [Myxococcales bacterium]
MPANRSKKVFTFLAALVFVAWAAMIGTATLADADQSRAQARTANVQVAPASSAAGGSASCECHWCATYGSENACACGSSGGCFKFIGWTRSAVCEQRQGECKAHGTID